MFARLLAAASSLFLGSTTSSSSDPTTINLDNDHTAEDQLQGELTAAASRAVMVATRSQEPIPTNDGLDDSFTANGTPKVVSKKRKIKERSNSKVSDARKRRKSASDFFEAAPDSIEHSETGELSQPINAKSLGASDNLVPKKVSLDPVEQHVLTADEVNEVKAKPKVSVVVSQQADASNANQEVHTSLEDSKKYMADISQSADSDAVPAEAQVAPSKTSPGNAITHKRFDSTEPEEVTPASIQGPTTLRSPGAHDDDNASDSDSDAAPETITLTAATAEAQASTDLAVKAIKKQEDHKRQKVKERENAQRLHRQKVEAKAARKAKRASRREEIAIAVDLHTPPTSQSPPPTTSTTLKGSPTHEDRGGSTMVTEIPKVLPMEILSSVPEARPPTPPLEALSHTHTNVQTIPRKQTPMSTTRKRAKDVIKGGVRIRVLSDGAGNGTLAPRADKQSKNIRERWLSGRGVVERRPWGGTAKGFARAR